MSVENLETYLNKNNFPMIRRCFNCKHWEGEIAMLGQKPAGYCKLNALYFALTLQPTVYPITKDFYLCENHKFKNEEMLSQVSKKVMLKDIIKRKDELE